MKKEELFSKKRKRGESAEIVVPIVDGDEIERAIQYVQEMGEAATRRQKLTNQMFQVPKLTMREGIMRVLENRIDPNALRESYLDTGNITSDDEAQSTKQNEFTEIQEDGKFTISEISGAMGMQKEEKTMSRVLNELRKCNPQIQSAAVRNGRVFQYKYYLQNTS